MSIKLAMISALKARYEADIEAADTTINIYLNNSVGIGEHPQHLEEIDKQLGKPIICIRLYRQCRDRS